jgi:hypothetical protein
MQSKKEGGFKIDIVYLEESYFNYLAKCLSFIYPTEVLL